MIYTRSGVTFPKRSPWKSRWPRSTAFTLLVEGGGIPGPSSWLNLREVLAGLVPVETGAPMCSEGHRSVPSCLSGPQPLALENRQCSAVEWQRLSLEGKGHLGVKSASFLSVKRSAMNCFLPSSGRRAGGPAVGEQTSYEGWYLALCFLGLNTFWRCSFPSIEWGQ